MVLMGSLLGLVTKAGPLGALWVGLGLCWWRVVLSHIHSSAGEEEGLTTQVTTDGVEAWVKYQSLPRLGLKGPSPHYTHETRVYCFFGFGGDSFGDPRLSISIDGPRVIGGRCEGVGTSISISWGSSSISSSNSSYSFSSSSNSSSC